MPQPWSDLAQQHLLDTTTCPRCGSAAIEGQVCSNCSADLGGPVAAELWRASVAAAEALRARQAVLDRMPSRAAGAVPRAAAASTPAPPAGSPLPGAAPGVVPAFVPVATATSSSQVTVQSVLAVAGAGLVAVAAIVFTF
ncbi:MAG: hypothetical protein JF618_11130, partial [Leifsonia sp.]|nr:hypothetical protein [Leifsonia sp.]